MAKSDVPILIVLKEAVQGLLFSSETDTELDPFVWQIRGDLDQDKLLKQVAAEEDTPIEETTLEELFQVIPSGQKKKFNALAAVLKNNLADIRVYRVGEVEIGIYIVGKTKDGNWAGLKTLSVET